MIGDVTARVFYHNCTNLDKVYWKALVANVYPPLRLLTCTYIEQWTYVLYMRIVISGVISIENIVKIYSDNDCNHTLTLTPTLTHTLTHLVLRGLLATRRKTRHNDDQSVVERRIEEEELSSISH